MTDRSLVLASDRNAGNHHQDSELTDSLPNQTFKRMGDIWNQKLDTQITQSIIDACHPNRADKF